jgi:hypothetical protein
MRFLLLAALVVGSPGLTGAIPPAAENDWKVTPRLEVVPPAKLPSPTKKVTLTLKEVPLRQALTELFRGTGFDVAVLPDVPNLPISFSVRHAEFHTALRGILDRAAAVYERPLFRAKRPPYLIKRRQFSLPDPGMLVQS